jgi:hypothetical protein
MQRDERLVANANALDLAQLQAFGQHLSGNAS